VTKLIDIEFDEFTNTTRQWHQHSAMKTSGPSGHHKADLRLMYYSSSEHSVLWLTAKFTTDPGQGWFFARLGQLHISCDGEVSSFAFVESSSEATANGTIETGGYRLLAEPYADGGAAACTFLQKLCSAKSLAIRIDGQKASFPTRADDKLVLIWYGDKTRIGGRNFFVSTLQEYFREFYSAVFDNEMYVEEVQRALSKIREKEERENGKEKDEREASRLPHNAAVGEYQRRMRLALFIVLGFVGALVSIFAAILI